MAESFSVVASGLDVNVQANMQPMIEHASKQTAEFFKRYLSMKEDDAVQPQMNEIVLILAAICNVFFAGVDPTAQAGLIQFSREIAQGARKYVEEFEKELAAKKTA